MRKICVTYRAICCCKKSEKKDIMKFEGPNYCVGISISLPMSIINRIDEKSKDADMSRSSFIRKIVVDAIENYEVLNNDN